MILLSAILMALTCGLDIDSLAAALHVETGMAYMSQGLPDRAVFEFNRAIEQDQDQADAYLGLGRAASLRGSPDASEEYYITYMGLRPHDPGLPWKWRKCSPASPTGWPRQRSTARRALELAPSMANAGLSWPRWKRPWAIPPRPWTGIQGPSPSTRSSPTKPGFAWGPFSRPGRTQPYPGGPSSRGFSR